MNLLLVGQGLCSSLFVVSGLICFHFMPFRDAMTILFFTMPIFTYGMARVFQGYHLKLLRILLIVILCVGVLFAMEPPMIFAMAGDEEFIP